jgi:hypothetical protein
MKLQVTAILALASSLPLAAPVESTVADDCGQFSSTFEVGLCADPSYGGYCHAVEGCTSQCYDLIDMGILGQFGSGISSVALPKGLECKFFAGRQCDFNSDWDGTYTSQAGMSGWTSANVDLNDRVVSLKCAKGTLSKRDNAISCPVRGRTVQLGLCADINYGGNCQDFTQCENSCYDLVDYGVINSFGDGVSSLVFPKGQECKFFTGRRCDFNQDWEGTYESQPEMDIWRDGSETVTVNLDNRVLSWICAAGTASKRDAAPEVVDSRDVVGELLSFISRMTFWINFERSLVIHGLTHFGETPN